MVGLNALTQVWHASEHCGHQHGSPFLPVEL
jgi:hypothetical protein